MSTTTPRRDRRERARRTADRQRHAGAHGRQQRRIGGAWIALGLAVALVALYLAAQALGFIRPGPPPVNLNDPKFSPGDVVGVHSPNEGNTHVATGTPVTYTTNPPTSGSHWAAPAGPVPWGIKDTQLPREAVVHNMEHGGIVVWYKALSGDETTKLKELVSQLRSNGYPKIVLMPYADMSDARIAITAWTWSLKLQAYDDAPLVQFVKQHYDGPDAPERGVP